MKALKPMTYVWSQAGSLVLGIDKEDFLSRASKAKGMGLTRLISVANTISDSDDKAMAYQAIAMLNDALTKGIVNQPIFLDWCSSGVSILSALTRDMTGMNSCGVFGSKPGNLYQTITNSLNRELNEEFTRSYVKSFTIPFYYGGDMNVREALGDHAEYFHSVYSKLLPGAYAFRQITTDAWNETAISYDWECADGYQVSVPVLKDSKECSVSFKGHSYKCHFKVQGTRATMCESSFGYYRNNHTKGLGANLTHSQDALILREMVGMAHLTRQEALDILVRATVETGDFITNEEPGLLGRLLADWEATNFPSIRWFEVLKECLGLRLPDALKAQLVQLANRLPEQAFDVICIHDEFGCLPKFVNDMRRNANTIYANLYRSNIMQYFNKKFSMNVPVGEFSQDIYDQLLEVDYLLS